MLSPHAEKWRDASPRPTPIDARGCSARDILRLKCRVTSRVGYHSIFISMVLTIIGGFDVTVRSRILSESTRVGSFTMFCKLNSFITASSLLCSLGILLCVICCLPQLISGMVKFPAIATFGGFF